MVITLEKVILFDPKQHIKLRAIHDQAFTLGDEIVAYCETEAEVENNFREVLKLKKLTQIYTAKGKTVLFGNL